MAGTNKDTFVFYNEWIDSMTTAGFTDEQIGRLVRAASNYTRTGRVPSSEELGAFPWMMFTTMRTRLDADAKKYTAKCASRSTSGKLGAEKRWGVRHDASSEESPMENVANMANAMPMANVANATQMATMANVANATQMATMANVATVADMIGDDVIGDDVIGEDRQCLSTPPLPPQGESGAGACDSESSKPESCMSDPDETSGSGSSMTVTVSALADSSPVAAEPSIEDTRALYDNFDRFWAAYPRKLRRDPAMRVWAELKPDTALTDKIVAAIDEQRRVDARFRETRFIPSPDRWLRDAEWTNEYDEDVVQARASPSANGNNPRNLSTGGSDWDALIEAGILSID